MSNGILFNSYHAKTERDTWQTDDRIWTTMWSVTIKTGRYSTKKKLKTDNIHSPHCTSLYLILENFEKPKKNFIPQTSTRRLRYLLIDSKFTCVGNLITSRILPLQCVNPYVSP